MLIANMYNERISTNNKLCAFVAGCWPYHARGLRNFFIDAVGRRAYHLLGNMQWRHEVALFERDSFDLDILVAILAESQACQSLPSNSTCLYFLTCTVAG